jgi:hypothetical protein
MILNRNLKSCPTPDNATCKIQQKAPVMASYFPKLCVLLDETSTNVPFSHVASRGILALEGDTNGEPTRPRAVKAI